MIRLNSFALADSFYQSVIESGYRIITIEIPDYITHVTLSDHQRAKGWKLTDKGMPKKVLDALANGEYRVGKNGYLTDIYGNMVVRNRKNVGQPKQQIINGQALYSGQMHYTVRSRVIDEMKRFFKKKFIEKLDLIPKDFIIAGLGFEVHKPYPAGDSTWDLDNFVWIYHKVMQDVLKDIGLVPEDDVKHINFIGPYLYVESKSPKLIVNLYVYSIAR